MPSPLASQVIDNARNAERVFQAGAVTVPMDSSTLRIAQIDNGPIPTWHTENAADITVADATLGAVEFKAKTLPLIVTMIRELFEDAQNLDQAARQSIGGALALELDRIALYGSGVDPQPRGIYNTAGLSGISMGANGGAITNFNPLIDAISAVWENNYEPNAGIMAPRTKTSLAKLTDTTRQLLQVPPTVDQLTWLATNQVSVTQTQGTSSDASDVFVGQWNQLLIGMRTGTHSSPTCERMCRSRTSGRSV
jgi:HK97 family phage major capsid protein